ncbi:glycine cleavage system protein R [Reinekea sp. G2M2-21]|uniref:glycine cleavage system protein R n=1 Tax=Reinekea sp. G2M2-21 TaxID=2788942 RepID=UPI0018AB85EA|nr:hypothetical protein [Reinekea sp. G2M2-21]
MKKTLIISVAGKDQDGFINTLTVKTKALGGKWLANKLAHLDGHIAGLLKMEIDAEQIDAFKTMMTEFDHIEATYYDSTDMDYRHETNSVQLTIEGEDRSGLTSDITRLLFDQDVKVEHFESQRYPVIGLGTGVFEAHLEVRLPASVTVDTLKDSLETLGGGLRVFLSETA